MSEEWRSHSEGMRKVPQSMLFRVMRNGAAIPIRKSIEARFHYKAQVMAPLINPILLFLILYVIVGTSGIYGILDKEFFL